MKTTNKPDRDYETFFDMSMKDRISFLILSALIFAPVANYAIAYFSS